MSDVVPLASPPFLTNLRRVFAIASPRRRLQLIVTLVLTAAGSVAELVTIGAVLPVLAIAAAPGSVAEIPLLGALLSVIAARFDVSPIVAASILLIAAALSATAIRLALAWVSQKFVYGFQQDLVMRVFGRALRQPYGWYVQQHSSVLIAGLEKINLVTIGIVSPMLLAVTSAVMALCITVFLFLIDPAAALFASLSIGAIYVAISILAKSTVARVSAELALVRTARIRTMQETLGGIRDIILDQSQTVFETKLDGIETRLRRSLVTANFLGMAPRLMVEGAAIVLVAVMALWFSAQPGGVLAAIPVLGALALGAQRLLPMVQSIYVAWSGYSVHAVVLNDIIALLDAPIDRGDQRQPGEPVRRFRETIALDRLSFAYVPGRPALAGIDLIIRKGERIGFIGKTGSGKSTLVDIVMGLLEPTSGALLVDGEPIGAANLANWKAQIAHVPQAIFLADDTIAANIAFGCAEHEIDQDRVAAAARKAGLLEFVDALPAGLRTSVGERGIRLSGGQRQRIGIARALYKNASLLILDEATSALDDETEAAVMRSVGELDRDLTVIMIAHRLSTIALCNRVYRLGEGRVVEVGAYDEIVANRMHANSAGSVEQADDGRDT